MSWTGSPVTELGTMRLATTRPRLLLGGLARNREDAQLAAIKAAADRLALSYCSANTTEDVTAAYRNYSHHLILIDTRNTTNFDPEAITKAIRQCNGGEYTTIVGIARSRVLEREELVVTQYLNHGMDRVVVESGSRAYWTNELVQLIRGPVDTSFRLRGSASLFCALDNCRDIVQITDSNNKVTWVNHAAEKILGFSRDEIMGKDIQELQTTGNQDSVLFMSDNPAARDCEPWFLTKLHQGKIWEGPINCKRKNGDYVPLCSRVAPVSFSNNKAVDQIIYVKDPPPLLRDKMMSDNVYDNLSNISRQLSLRKASFDVTSLISEAPSTYLRRPSHPKVHSLSIEAPITKVINIIMAAQENQPVYIAQALDKVVQILRTSGSPDLFSPEIDSGRKARDPVTTDLLGALLASSSRGIPRRPSTDKSGSGSGTPRPSLPGIEAAPVQIRQLLADGHTWDFDIIALEKLTDKRPLVWLGMTTLLRFEVTKTLRIEESTLQNWLTLIEANYHSSNSYHNSTHAADVMQATAYFLEKDRIKCMMDDVDEAIVLIAAIIHDVDHPGRNSAFLCNSSDKLAILYNDTTVLENHHSAFGFKLTTSDDRVNIFQNLEPDSYKVVRQGLIDTVLATDMSKHFVHVNKFFNVFGARDDVVAPEMNLSIDTAEHNAIVKRMLIKCADISNPARPQALCVEWAKRIVEEYFSQTDEEKEKGLPVVMPQYDRTSCSFPRTQIGFYDFFITDMFSAWHEFAECPELMENVQNNYVYWKSQLDYEEEEEDEDVASIEERGDDSETETLRDSEDMIRDEGPSDTATSTSRLSGCDRTLSGTDRRLSAGIDS